MHFGPAHLGQYSDLEHPKLEQLELKRIEPGNLEPERPGLEHRGLGALGSWKSGPLHLHKLERH